MRMLIAPNAAIDAPTYEQYQRCLSLIPLNQDLKAVAAAREACKAKALKAAYRVPPRTTTGTDSGVRNVPTVKDRTGYQSQQLERFQQ
jgi:hypothetical protein